MFTSLRSMTSLHARRRRNARLACMHACSRASQPFGPARCRLKTGGERLVGRVVLGASLRRDNDNCACPAVREDKGRLFHVNSLSLSPPVPFHFAALLRLFIYCFCRRRRPLFRSRHAAALLLSPTHPDDDTHMTMHVGGESCASNPHPQARRRDGLIDFIPDFSRVR